MKMELLHKNPLIFGGILFFGYICGGLAKPSSDEDSHMQADDNYNDYEFDENDNLSTDGERLYAPDPRSTAAPYFDSVSDFIHIQPGEDARLPCPVKNIQQSNIILWFNSTSHDQMLTQGNAIIGENKRITIDDNHTLKIKNATEFDTGTYFCKLIPNNLQYQVKLNVSTDSDESSQEQQTDGNNNSSATNIYAVIPTILTVFIARNLFNDNFRRL